MSFLLKRLLLATALVATPALAASDTAEEPKEETAEVTGEASATDAGTEDAAASDDTLDQADADDADEESDSDSDKATTEADLAEEWAEKLRKRHHEGDVALGVCGARMTALMWFYQSSVADGRDDLKPAYDAIRESRTVLKTEAERRAIDDGVGTSVSVMNEHSTELWEGLVEASESPETFQAAHDDLYGNVQECLSLFFNRGVKPPAEAVSGETDTEDTTDEQAD